MTATSTSARRTMSPGLDDRKWAYVRLEGRAFGDVPLNLEYKLEVWDSPNSAGIIIDAIRAAKIAKDRGIGGACCPPRPTGMKSPPEQREDTEGRARPRPSSRAPSPADVLPACKTAPRRHRHGGADAVRWGSVRPQPCWTR